MTPAFEHVVYWLIFSFMVSETFTFTNFLLRAHFTNVPQIEGFSVG